jgi:hypothetical protein
MTGVSRLLLKHHVGPLDHPARHITVALAGCRAVALVIVLASPRRESDVSQLRFRPLVGLLDWSYPDILFKHCLTF